MTPNTAARLLPPLTRVHIFDQDVSGHSPLEQFVPGAVLEVVQYLLRNTGAEQQGAA